VAVPANVREFEATIDISSTYSGTTAAVLGAVGASAGIWVRIDRGDGLPFLESFTPLFDLISAVAWGRGASGTDSRKVRVPFTRASSSAGDVTVLAGVQCHADAGGVFAIADVTVEADIASICVRST